MRRRSPRLRALRLALGWLLGSVAALALALALALWATLPKPHEQLQLGGLTAPVAISLDALGIPRITAQNELDAATAIGWLHARDRMFQMELMRRGASGRLAEIAGAPALRADRFTRTLGLADRATADLATLSPETRALLDAYAAGVNARIAQRGRFIAPEFLALGTPEPWRPEHSLLWGKVMGLWLSGNWRSEIERAQLARNLDAERLWQLWPADTSPGLPDRLADLTPLLQHFPRFGEDAPLPASASNAWVLDSRTSGSGGAMLASDPHLGFAAPILWYLARIELPAGQFRAGATSPGVPMIVIGRNESLAWGFTTTHADTQDVFIEREIDETHYATEGGPRPFTTRDELIRVRGAPPQVLRIRETRHGPVLSDLEDPRPRNGTALAVAMANLAPEDSAAEGLLMLNRATSLAAAAEAAARITSPSQNLMVAERAGGIAMFITGRIPLRRAGEGAIPAPGHDASHDWQGFIPFDQLPHRIAPESGRLVNANNRVTPPDAPAFLGRDWPGDWRFRRIHAMLDANPRPDAAVMAGMQRDATSPLAQASLPLLRGLTLTGPAGIARELLTAWEGEMAANQPQPLIWNAWARRFLALVLREAGVPESAASPEFLAFLLAGNAPLWCASPDCAPQAARALEQVMAELTPTHGPDLAAWRWGTAHPAIFEHPLLRALPVLRDLTRLSAPSAGDGQTVLRATPQGGMAGHTSFTNSHGAGLRLVADLATTDGLLAITATGQSGHPLSAHWGDMLPLWRDGTMPRLSREPATMLGRIELRP
ncbi:penicillin acylase family protein [Rhodovarius sp.]|uniref:penicillin acylase family protein n=1 Tax=Rhodovarius sp. TaxID=2972673 RepID=UPI0034A4185B